jgi:hypothetical protein
MCLFQRHKYGNGKYYISIETSRKYKTIINRHFETAGATQCTHAGRPQKKFMVLKINFYPFFDERISMNMFLDELFLMNIFLDELFLMNIFINEQFLMNMFIYEQFLINMFINEQFLMNGFR